MITIYFDSETRQFSSNQRKIDKINDKINHLTNRKSINDSLAKWHEDSYNIDSQEYGRAVGAGLLARRMPKVMKLNKDIAINRYQRNSDKADYKIKRLKRKLEN